MMYNADLFIENVLKDLEVELTDEFDRNFERKAFFDEKWPGTKWPVNKGSLMQRTGRLRGSMDSQIQGHSIIWNSTEPHASIHNEGGEITVTEQMKKFFWAMYYKASGAITKLKSGQPSNTARNRRMTDEAAIWKSLALQKTGSKMKIPARRFIGNHPQVDAAVKRVTDSAIQHLEKELTEILKQRKTN